MTIASAPYTLILLRHGESEWNAKNLFTGWVDVDLNEKGLGEARRGGELLAEAGLLPDVVHTSLLKRAIKTSQIALEACDRMWIPVVRNWRLNERHYGALQGKNKKETLEAYGEEQFMLWRRSYDTPPPPIDPEDPWAQTHDARYSALPPEARPATECLADVVRRLIPYWEDVIVAEDLRAGKTVLVAAHGNSLRALVKHLDGLITIYAHNEKNLVETGQRVKQGQTLARVGQTGRATGPHLHFEVRKERVPRNPLFFLPE